MKIETIYSIFKRDLAHADKITADELCKDVDFIKTKECDGFCLIGTEYWEYLVHAIKTSDLKQLGRLKSCQKKIKKLTQ